MLAMTYDNRDTPSPHAVSAWVDAGARGRWQFDDAVDAIKAHYAESTEFIKPGHITARIRARRRVPAQHVQVEEHRDPPANPLHVAKVMAELRRQLGWTKRKEAS